MPRVVLKVYPHVRRLHFPTHIVVCVAQTENLFAELSREEVPEDEASAIRYLRTRLLAVRSGIVPRVLGIQNSKRVGLGDYRVVKQVAQELNYFEGFMAFDARTVGVDQVLKALEVLGVTSKRPVETNAMAVVSQREDMRMCFLSIE